mmetsp:Transcript_11288/g.32011  ORF Transcript_11288/g.32011 Transcript_11288/m.32011 type:complete len:247 (-) Transcript_11288:2012-2752(-)
MPQCLLALVLKDLARPAQLGSLHGKQPYGLKPEEPYVVGDSEMKVLRAHAVRQPTHRREVVQSQHGQTPQPSHHLGVVDGVALPQDLVPRLPRPQEVDKPLWACGKHGVGPHQPAYLKAAEAGRACQPLALHSLQKVVAGVHPQQHHGPQAHRQVLPAHVSHPGAQLIHQLWQKLWGLVLQLGKCPEQIYKVLQLKRRQARGSCGCKGAEEGRVGAFKAGIRPSCIAELLGGELVHAAGGLCAKQL